ncbi:MAG: LysM peptidoglycan-binding domain-containing protein [Treponema sp.]|nr:LysM peptidoglycan-binding domain-containing protein [Treponema sp.]
MKTLGIKLADNTFFPILKEEEGSEKNLELTTVHNNQTKVMVDLYRSSRCIMKDAEYVDSLQIENLNSQPEGQARIYLSLLLDENNKLSAKIKDAETGNQDSTSVILLERPETDLMEDDEVNFESDEEEIPELAENGVKVLSVQGPGLLATAEALLSKERENEADEVPVSEPEPEPEAEPKAESAPEAEPEVEAGTEAEPEPEAETVPASEPEPEPEPEQVSAPETETTDLPESAENINNGDDMNVDKKNEDEDFSSLDFSSLDLDLPEIEDTPAQEEKTDSLDLDLDLPDFPESEAESETESPDLPDFSENENDSLDLPDFPESESDSSELPDFSENESESDSLDLPDFPEETESPNFDDFDIPEQTPAAAGGFDFAGLYDDESALDDEGEGKKRTRLPLIICIICAVICILATLAILFIIPSKYNLLSRNSVKEAAAESAAPTPIEAPAEPEPEPEPAPEPIPEPEPEPEPEIPEAKEDEIVVIEKAEEVVPQQPPVIEEKPKNIVYKIKWGDTLWDIADTYYKNPWRYKEIAKYNGIKDPDHIVSGTIIEIPAE